MATASAKPQDRAITAKAAGSPSRATQRTEVQVAAPNRREFLFYIWGASMALLLGEATAGILWFAFPRFKEGEFGGVFTFNPDDLPAANTEPVSVPSGRFHITRDSSGVLALYGVCTHLGCLPKWVPTNERFECPCHGSKFELNGGYIEGPAPRSLDRFVMTITYVDGTSVQTGDDGGAVAVDPNKAIERIEIDTSAKILGDSIG